MFVDIDVSFGRTYRSWFTDPVEVVPFFDEGIRCCWDEILSKLLFFLKPIIGGSCSCCLELLFIGTEIRSENIDFYRGYGSLVSFTKLEVLKSWLSDTPIDAFFLINCV
jgi:hypothetical protein